MLSHRLLVLGLVGHYPTNYLISRKLLPKRRSLSFNPAGRKERYGVLGQISLDYPPLRGRSLTCYSAVRHYPERPKPIATVQLACIRRTASVRPEPGSNSKYLTVSIYYSAVKVLWDESQKKSRQRRDRHTCYFSTNQASTTIYS